MTERWITTTAAGKPVDVYEPLHPHPAGFMILYLHGHDGATWRNDPLATQELEKRGLRCICPHGGRSWWGWRICEEFDPEMTPEQYLLGHLLPWIAEQWGTAGQPPPVGLTGFEMGGQGAIRMAYKHPREFPVVAAISPAVDFHEWHGHGLPLDEIYRTREAARQDTATLHLHPLNWPRHQLILCDPADQVCFDGAERLASKLSSTGIPFEMDLTTSTGGDRGKYVSRMLPRVLDFLVEGLEKEQNRV